MYNLFFFSTFGHIACCVTKITVNQIKNAIEGEQFMHELEPRKRGLLIYCTVTTILYSEDFILFFMLCKYIRSLVPACMPDSGVAK